MRVLRDQGPKPRDFICAMLTLHTWMDSNGFAYPSLRTWATGARMSVNTLRKHLKTAVDSHWIGVEEKVGKGEGRGKQWRHNVYRAAVPDTVDLSEKDEELSLALISKFGEIEDPPPLPLPKSSGLNSAQGVSPMSDTAKAPGVSTMLTQQPATPGSPLQAPSKGFETVQGVSNDGSEVYQNKPLGVSKKRSGVSNDTARCVTQADTEVLKSEVSEVFEHPLTEGAVPSDRTARDAISKAKVKNGLTRQQKVDKAATALAGGLDAEFIRKQYGLTVEEVRRESKPA